MRALSVQPSRQQPVRELYHNHTCAAKKLVQTFVLRSANHKLGGVFDPPGWVPLIELRFHRFVLLNNRSSPYK